MDHWDYRTVVMSRGLPGHPKREIDRAELEKELNDFGEQGFELVQILPEQRLEGEESGHLMIFRQRRAGSAHDEA